MTPWGSSCPGTKCIPWVLFGAGCSVAFGGWEDAPGQPRLQGHVQAKAARVAPWGRPQARPGAGVGLLLCLAGAAEQRPPEAAPPLSEDSQRLPEGLNCRLWSRGALWPCLRLLLGHGVLAVQGGQRGTE